MISSGPARALTALAILAVPGMASGQLAGIAGAAGAVPVSIGPVQAAGMATIDRIASTTGPRTVATVQSALFAPLGKNAGFWIGGAMERVRETDSIPRSIRPVGGVWGAIGSIALHVDVASHAARLGGSPSRYQFFTRYIPVQTDSGSALLASRDSSLVPSSPGRTRAWSDVETSAVWRSARFSISGTLGVRPGLDVLPRAFWARIGAGVDLGSWYGVVLAAGTAPSRVGMGVPASRFASVALRLGPRRRAADVSRTEPAAARAFSLAAISAGRYRVTYVAHGVRSVELSGDFDGWAPVRLAEIQPGLWQADLLVEPGVYRMNVRIDGGAWMPPPGSTVVQDDFGGSVGIVEVR